MPAMKRLKPATARLKFRGRGPLLRFYMLNLMAVALWRPEPQSGSNCKFRIRKIIADQILNGIGCKLLSAW